MLTLVLIKVNCFYTMRGLEENLYFFKENQIKNVKNVACKVFIKINNFNLGIISLNVVF